MKLTIAFSATLIICAQARNYRVTLNDDCNKDNLEDAAADAGYDLLTLLGVNDENIAEDQVNQLCDEARARNSNTRGAGGAYPFSKITDKGWQFDNNFFDGGTLLNEEYEPVEVEFDEVYENIAQDTLITYPDDSVSKNFADCQAQSAMCCWVQDRYDDGNGDGNCEEDDCKDADPADNTNVCYVDLEAGSQSSHVGGGDAIFSRTEDEGAVHCHGFAWDQDETSTDYRYRGNVLFFVSMYDHLSERGYVREVPGAPMCGCVEKMPVVEESDCTEPDIEEEYSFVFRSNGNHIARITDVTINYNACTNNELADRFAELKADGKTDAAAESIFEEQIVGQGNCNDVFDTWFESKYGYVSANA